MFTALMYVIKHIREIVSAFDQITTLFIRKFCGGEMLLVSVISLRHARTLK